MSGATERLLGGSLALAVCLALPGPATATEAETAAARVRQAGAGDAGVEAAPVTDDSLSARLEDIFSRSEDWERIRVSVRGGVVTLTGDVLREEVAEQAVELSRSLDGVVFVDDQLDVSRNFRRTVHGALERLADRAYELVAFVPLLILAGAVLAVFHVVSRFAADRGETSSRLSGNRFVRDITRRAIRLVAMLVGLVIVLDLLDATAAVSALLGTAGIVGLAIGFAFRDLVENYIASVLLSLRQPFAPNDHVVIEGKEGRVLRLTSRATILLTLEGNHLRIPNADVFKSSILNYTRNPLRRFEFVVGVGTEENVRHALELGARAVSSLDGVLEEPKVLAVAEALGDSTVQLRFHAWMDQREHDIAKIKSAAIAALKSAYDEEGVEMPEPIYRVRTAPIEGAEAQAQAQAQDAQTERSRYHADAGMDVSADAGVEGQVESERRSSGEDLLSEHAPLE